MRTIIIDKLYTGFGAGWAGDWCVGVCVWVCVCVGGGGGGGGEVIKRSYSHCYINVT